MREERESVWEGESVCVCVCVNRGRVRVRVRGEMGSSGREGGSAKGGDLPIVGASDSAIPLLSCCIPYLSYT